MVHQQYSASFLFISFFSCSHVFSACAKMDKCDTLIEYRKTLGNPLTAILLCSLIWCSSVEVVITSQAETFEAAFQGQCPRKASDGICQHVCRNHSPRTFACYCLPGFHLQHNGYGCTNDTDSVTTTAASSTPPSLNLLGNVSVSQERPATPRDCSKVKCRNGGWCDEKGEEGATCFCPLGTTGKYCQKRAAFSTPHFSGRSYAMLPLLTSRPGHYSFDVAITIRPEKKDGLFFYVGQNVESHQDFVALLLVDAYVVLRIRLADSAVIVRSSSRVSLNESVQIEAGRKGGSDFYLRVGHTPMQITSKPELENTELDLMGNVYIGGLPDPENLQRGILGRHLDKSPSLFQGCITDLSIDEQKFVLQPAPFGDVVDGVNVDRCNVQTSDEMELVAPCVKTNCLNGGRCTKLDDDLEELCECTAGFVGRRCEIDLESSIPFFNGSSYLTYEIGQMREHIKHSFHLRLIFRPSQRPRPSFNQEVLLHVGSTRSLSMPDVDRSSMPNEISEDYVAVSLQKGLVEVSLNLGDTLVIARSKEATQVGVWCEVEVRRTGRLVELYIDNKVQTTERSRGSFAEFNLNNQSYIYLGGVPSDGTDKQSDSLNDSSFNGCIDLNKVFLLTSDVRIPTITLSNNMASYTEFFYERKTEVVQSTVWIRPGGYLPGLSMQ